MNITLVLYAVSLVAGGMGMGWSICSFSFSSKRDSSNWFILFVSIALVLVGLQGVLV
jgi:hypothetical protein